MTSRTVLLALFVTGCASTTEPTETPTTSGNATPDAAADLQADCNAFDAVSFYDDVRGLAVFDDKGYLQDRGADYASLKLSDPAAKKIASDYKAHFDKAVVEQPKLAAALTEKGSDTQDIMQQQLEARSPAEPKAAQVRLCEPYAEKIGTSKRAKCSALARASYTALRFAAFNDEKTKAALGVASGIASELGGTAPDDVKQLTTDVDAIKQEAAKVTANFSDAAHKKQHEEIKRILAATGDKIEKTCGSRF